MSSEHEPNGNKQDNPPKAKEIERRPVIPEGVLEEVGLIKSDLPGERPVPIVTS